MKARMRYPALILLAVVLAACVPVTATLAPIQGDQAQPAIQVTATPNPFQPTPAVTSRGSNLVASDPGTVVLGTGTPVLVEFFRFT